MIRELDAWADGYVVGSGRPCVIVSAAYDESRDIAPLGVTTAPFNMLETRQLVLIVHDADDCVRTLREICAVAAVQLS
jgi:hypothetical protein